jgi:hypothetical protein
MNRLNKKYGMTLRDKTPEGACPVCAIVHGKDQPHRLQSLAYYFKFYDMFGRWPDPDDATAHCPDEVKDYWREAMASRSNPRSLPQR